MTLKGVVQRDGVLLELIWYKLFGHGGGAVINIQYLPGKCLLPSCGDYFCEES